jgi:hypothetical protein
MTPCILLKLARTILSAGLAVNSPYRFGPFAAHSSF